MGTVTDCILNRRSVRLFKAEKITNEIIMQLLNSAAWAPSGNNLQPWKFVVVMDNAELKDKIASLSAFSRWLKLAPCLIIVYLDNQLSYDRVKDVQAVGASIQNLLLTAHELELGACWIGEILEKAIEVNNLLNVPGNYELMAVIAAGHPGRHGMKSKRRDVKESIFSWH